MTRLSGRLAAVRQRRRVAVREIVRLLAIAVALFGLYYVVPLDSLTSVPLSLTLTVGLLVLGAVSVWQLRAVIDAEHPSTRAIESLAGIIPLFLILFASSYYVMSLVEPTSFNEHLTRTDSLYLTITVLSTVGFGDIVATSQAARVDVMFQMVLNIIIFSLGVRVLTRAVKIGNARHQPGNQAAAAPVDSSAGSDSTHNRKPE